MNADYESGVLTLIADYYECSYDDDYERPSRARAMRVFDAIDRQKPELLSDEAMEACLRFARSCMDFEPRKVNRRAWAFFIAYASDIFVLDESVSLSLFASGALQLDALRELDHQTRALALLDESELTRAYFALWRPETRAVIVRAMTGLTSYPTLLALVGTGSVEARDAICVLGSLGRPAAEYLERVCLGGGPQRSLAFATLLRMGAEASPSLLTVALVARGRARERALERLAATASDQTIARMWGETASDMHECARSRLKAMGEAALPFLADAVRADAYADEAVRMMQGVGPKALRWLSQLADLKLPVVAEAQRQLTRMGDVDMAWQVNQDATR
jgi:hypothetical protein